MCFIFLPSRRLMPRPPIQKKAWAVHVGGTRNLAQAILEHALGCWLLNVGSWLIYGETARSGQPLDEMRFQLLRMIME